MSNKGQFQKNNKAAKKKFKSTYHISNDAHAVKLPTEIKKTTHNHKDYIPFGTSNLFPQQQSELNRKSAISRSVIKSKRNYITGVGFTSENLAFENWTPNPNETLTELTSKLIDDKLIGGNAYYEIVKNKDNVNFYHKDHTKCRISKDGMYVIIHPDWSKYESNKNLSINLPLYPEFELVDGMMRSMVHIKDYESEFDYYGIPSNIGGNDSANINYKTNKWNLSRIENGFNISGVLNIEANFSPEDAQTFDEDFNSKFTGESKQGQILKIISEIGDETNTSKFIPMQSTEDGNWQQLHEQATSEIIISNQWFSSLAGVNVSSGFDTNRIRNDYRIAISTIIPFEQNSFIDSFTMVLNNELNMGIDDLAFINKSPLDNIDLIDFTDTVTKNERRTALGYEEVEDEDVKQSLNGTQVTSMLDVIERVTLGTISEKAGIQVLITSFGLTEEVAKEFFK